MKRREFLKGLMASVAAVAVVPVTSVVAQSTQKPHRCVWEYVGGDGTIKKYIYHLDLGDVSSTVKWEPISAALTGGEQQ